MNVTTLLRSPFYKLNDDGSVDNIPLEEFFALEDAPNKPIARTSVGDVMISTVFLGCSFNSTIEPIALFETMIIGGPLSGSSWKFSTLDKAKVGHAEVVDAILSDLSISPDSEVVKHEYFHQGQRLH